MGVHLPKLGGQARCSAIAANQIDDTVVFARQTRAPDRQHTRGRAPARTRVSIT